MAKMVGYACNIKLQWLNHAVAMLDENLTEAEYKEKMNEYLSFEIDSPTRLRKTREILMNVWYYDSEEITPIRQEALKLMKAHPECGIDYIHGSQALTQLVSASGGCGILLPPISKASLFPAIRAGGVLPRKTFSMGSAPEKRYYMECRKIL